MRCFLAIDLPEKVKKELREVQKNLPPAKMTLVDPDKIHITLKFFGEIEDSKYNKIKEVLKKFKFKKFKAKLGVIGVFPGPSFIRVVWVGVEPKQNLLELHNLLDGGLGNEGFKRDKSFENHATLARVKFLKDKEAFVKGLTKIKIEPLEFFIEGISLKKSTLTPEGPIYEELFHLKFE